MVFENVIPYYLARELYFNVRDNFLFISRDKNATKGPRSTKITILEKKCPWHALLRPRFYTLKIRVR